MAASSDDHNHMQQNHPARKIFLTGGTGYMGSRLLSLLIERRHEVRALAREASLDKLPAGCTPVAGDALKQNAYTEQVRGCDTFMHLIGVAHPSPSKAEEFRSVDLASVQAAVPAAVSAGVRHFVYVSVAHPAPIMQAYWKVRVECEEMIRNSKLNATILRPWYVLGPGHRWPYALLPMYWILERLPGARDTARRLGMVSIDQMLRALIRAVDHPADGFRIVPAQEIRRKE
jgi:uncharacterized protein YbjT (DUF2867 family)